LNGDFHNPQQEPGTERRLLLVFVLTFIVLMVSQPLLMKYIKQQPPPEKQEQQTKTPPAPAPVAPAVAPAATAAQRAKSSAPATRQAATEQEIVVENDLYRITFTNRGAQVKSWILKKYDDEQGKPLDLVNQGAAAQYGYPLSLWTYDEGLRKKLAGALYVASVNGTVHVPADVTFEYADGDTTVRKTFRFDHSYVLKVETSVTQNGQAVSAFPAWPAGFGDQSTPASYAAARVDVYDGATNWHGGEKVNRTPLKNVSGGATIKGPFQWAAVTNQYFGAAFLPDDPRTAALVTLRNAIEIPKDAAKPEGEKIKMEVVGGAVGDTSGLTRERIFAGPMNLDVLQSIKATPIPGQEPYDLAGMVDFGTYLGFIAKPLFLWLRWTHAHWVANWGWSIIILTVIINVALFPLRLSQMKSALKMQKLQPQVNAIKKKYEKYTMRDPRRQEMNQEIAALFKREGANPVGGCIPMLIQFPFLIAFYSMLGSAIELRHAHFLWLHDLSAMDPYHILPIGIIITMVLVQRMTPQAGMDPAQQKMMMLIMPLMLGFISWTLSSGLCVYWVVGNLIAIAQQLWLNRTSFGREMRAEAEKRARKKAGK
jgi:YidC/Oxa1 family membrane protein insertase